MNPTILVTRSLDGVIGVNGLHPFSNIEDIKDKNERIKNQTVILGRNAYEALGGYLPSAQIIPLSRTGIEGIQTAKSLDDALELTIEGRTPYILGGEETFNSALMNPLVRRVVITTIPEDFRFKIQRSHVERVSYFHELSSEWKEISCRPKESIIIRTYERK